MVRRIIALVIGLTLTANVAASGICGQAKKEFGAAVEVYLKEGVAAFVKRFLENGPLINDKRSVGQAQNLAQVEQFFGEIQSASILSTKPLGERACYLIGILEYRDGPAFAVATYYKTSDGVGPTSMFFKTEPEQILPKKFLVP